MAQVIAIDAWDDPRLAPYRDLPDRQLARADGQFVCEGRWLVERLLASDFPVESVLVSEDGPALENVPENTPVYAASKAVIEKSIGYKFHRGALAVSRRRPLMSVGDLVATLPERAVVGAMVGVHDPDNVGAIVRAAAGLGVHAILVDGQTHDLFYRRALRAAMGTTLFMPIARCETIEAGLAELHAAGVQSVATVARPVGDTMGGHTVQAAWDVPHAPRAAILFGTEGPGLSDAVAGACQHAVTLPMHRGTDSLNVATAAAVFFHEWLRPG